jgi:polyphosphate kinase
MNKAQEQLPASSQPVGPAEAGNDTATRTADLAAPEYYINREISQLEFNRRVLEQAKDATVPLLERLFFLCICSRNLDEFFEVRVAGLKTRFEYGSFATGPDGLYPAEALDRISEVAHELVDEQYQVLNRELIPQLEAQDVRFLRRDQWEPKLGSWVKSYFEREVLPVLTPIGLDPAHPFPRVLNKNLNFIVSLAGKDAFGRDSGLAIVQVPRSLPRLIRVPRQHAGGPDDFLFLSSIIHARVGDIFPGMDCKGCYQFRVTRNSDLLLEYEEVDDLLRAVEGELPSRRFGDEVRLEVADNCPAELCAFLTRKFGLAEADVYKVNGPVNLNRLQTLRELVDKPELKYRPFTPHVPDRLARPHDIFAAIRQRDILLHHPFESFTPVLALLRQAAADPDVVAIKQTLYRTGPRSSIVDLLVEAARKGKEVTVVVELRARFDEEDNIQLANRLHEVGAHVSYGVVGYKTHAKMMLIVRREKGGLRRYVHLGTGNYHASTARLYTDYGLMTCDEAFGEDVHKVFLQLTGLGRPSHLKKLLQSPFTLHKTMLALIDRESQHAAAGKPAKIIAKMNSLTEPQIIQALYRASQAGVTMNLIVRGNCCLRPGVHGVSENIEVRSVVGRFLEHARICYFHNAGVSEVYCGSADWMERNFFLRVESSFPIEDARLAERVVREGLDPYLADNTQAWRLEGDGTYRRVKPDGDKPVAAQSALLEAFT